MHLNRLHLYSFNVRFRLFSYSQSFSVYRFRTAGSRVFSLPLFARATFCPCNAFILSLYQHCLSPNIICVYHIQRRLKIFKEPRTAWVLLSHKCTKHTPSRCIIEMSRNDFNRFKSVSSFPHL